MRIQYYQNAWQYGLDLNRLTQQIQLGNSLGIRTILALAPRQEDLPTFWSDANAQQAYRTMWGNIAGILKDYQPAGYDLFNEPKCPAAQWNAYLPSLVAAIRAYDTQTPLVIQPVLYDTPQINSIAQLIPVSDKNAIYSIHVVEPMPFTNQGISGRPGGLSYPGWVEGIWWDAATLEGSMAPVWAFQQRYGVRIQVGEFTAVWWDYANNKLVQGAFEYIRDCTRIFAKYGWDSEYHAFREWYLYPNWDGFSLEPMSPDRPMPSDRLQVMLSYWRG